MKFNLLIIDDDDDIQLILTSLLSTIEGVQVVSAPDGNAGMKRLTQDHFSGIILDHQLPDMTGDEILAYIQTMSAESKPRVVMLSARDSGEISSSWIEGGAEAVFTKPFNPIELVGELRNTFGF